MRTVREILKESDSQEIADILLLLHLNTLFEQAEPEDTVADIRRLVGEWTKRIIFNILNAAPQERRKLQRTSPLSASRRSGY